MKKEFQGTKVKVTAYSGYIANERPIYFLLDHNKLIVQKVLARWRDQHNDYFKIFADDGCVYKLTWQRDFDLWYAKKGDRE